MSVDLSYAELTAQVKSYTERQDTAFIAEIPTFINLAENRLASELKQQGFQTVVEGILPITSTMVKPAFWRETISFNYTDNTGKVSQILLRSYEFLRNFWPNAATQDVPRYYADYNFSNFVLAPTPVAAYNFELVYYARLTPLTVAVQSNWLTINAPQALLFATLLEAFSWCQNEERTSFYQSQYNMVRDSLLGESQERLGDRNTKVARG